MSVTFNVSALHADMQRYHEAIQKAGNSRKVTSVATQCFTDALTKVPEGHVLRAHFNALRNMVVGEFDTADEDIVDHIGFLATQVRNLFHGCSMHAAAQDTPDVVVDESFGKAEATESFSFVPGAFKPRGDHPIAVASLTHSASKEYFPIPTSAALSPAAPPAALMTRDNSAHERVDELDRALKELMSTFFVQKAEDAAKFEAILASQTKERMEFQREREADRVRMTAENESLKNQMRGLARELDDKLVAAEIRFAENIAEVKAQASSQFIEFTVKNWSTIALTVPAKSPAGTPPMAALYSTDKSVKVWGHEFWLKVEKTAERVGLYLCCGSDGDTLFSGRFPIKVDYQLMVRKRGTDEGVCAAQVYRTTFGKERAWGESRFSTEAALLNAGAYRKGEDEITFGCKVYPLENLLWGQVVHLSAPAPAVVGAAAPAAPATVGAAVALAEPHEHKL